MCFYPRTSTLVAMVQVLCSFQRPCYFPFLMEASFPGFSQRERCLYVLELGHHHYHNRHHRLDHPVRDAVHHPGEPQALVGHRLVAATLSTALFWADHLLAPR